MRRLVSNLIDCSSMAGTLYTYPDNFRAYKILIAAEYSRNKIKVVSEPPEFVLGQTNKTDEFLAKFPLGKVPAFESADGVCIFESNAIAYYVSSPALRGTSDVDQALVQQYINFADNEILPPACTWVFPTQGLMQYNKEATRLAQENLKQLLTVLNDTLATRTFLVGERVTLADITVSCNLLSLYKHVLEPEFRAPYTHVNRWFLTCINQPQFRTVLGEVSLCEKMAQFDAKKYAELFPKEKKEKKPQEPKKQTESKKPQQQQQPKKPAEALEPEDQEDEDQPKPPKFVDPYRDLPKSPFDFDAFKRCFSNEEPSVAIPYFWEKFDKEGWSIWRANYNYNDQLTRGFMASNLVSGMFQRLEKLHKYGFAVVYILGEDMALEISGVWVLRGQELAFDLVEDWNIDAPSYTFVKLDPDNIEHRETVNCFLRNDRGDIFEGKPIKDLKIYK